MVAAAFVVDLGSARLQDVFLAARFIETIQNNTNSNSVPTPVHFNVTRSLGAASHAVFVLTLVQTGSNRSSHIYKLFVTNNERTFQTEKVYMESKSDCDISQRDRTVVDST